MVNGTQNAQLSSTGQRAADLLTGGINRVNRLGMGSNSAFPASSTPAAAQDMQERTSQDASEQARGKLEAMQRALNAPGRIHEAQLAMMIIAEDHDRLTAQIEGETLVSSTAKNAEERKAAVKYALAVNGELRDLTTRLNEAKARLEYERNDFESARIILRTFAIAL